ncbi:MAG: hypothetical protein AAFX87_25785 [Bacteroidota bacterium]
MSEEHNRLIEGYLEGSLGQEDMQEVERLLDSSEDFAKELALQKRQLAYVEAIGRKELKARMLQDFRRVNKSAQRSKAGMSRLLWYAAASIALVVAVVFLTRLSEESNHEAVFTAYYAPYDGVDVSRGDNGLFLSGVYDYEAGNYQKALRTFLATGNEHIAEEQLYLLISSCYLSLENPDSSMVWLDKISPEAPALILGNKDWYLALTQLKKGQIEQARTLLEGIVNQKSAFAANASSLLKERIFKEE